MREPNWGCENSLHSPSAKARGGIALNSSASRGKICALAAKPLAKGMFSGIISDSWSCARLTGKQEVIP